MMKPKLNDLLCGVKVMNGEDGIVSWFDFPRYRVVAFHCNDDNTMFVEVLDSSGEALSVQKMPLDSDQWAPWINPAEFAETLRDFAEKLASKQEPLDPEFARILDENLSDLYLRDGDSNE